MPVLPPHAHKLPRHGVTIVELMVTLAIMAVLLAVALPSMRDFVARKRMEGVAQELLTDLRLLKSQQQLQNRRAVAISFGSTTEQTCYVLYFVGVNMPHCNCAAAADAICGAATILGRPEQIRLVSVPRNTGVTVTANQRFIKLLGFDGLPENELTLQAVVESAQVGSIRVSTNELGRPSICSVSGTYGAVNKCPP